MQQLVDAVFKFLGDESPGYAGKCAECEIYSQAVNSDIKTEGGTIAAVRIDGEEVVEACDVCKFVANKFGITTVEP